jgi:ribulose-phosphate 3-epimerase
MGQLPQPLNDIATVVQQITMAASNLESVFEVIEETPTVTDEEDAEELLPIEGNVSFENARRMSDVGADIFVAGTSSIFKAGVSMDDSVAKLREAIK